MENKGNSKLLIVCAENDLNQGGHLENFQNAASGLRKKCDLVEFLSVNKICEESLIFNVIKEKKIDVTIIDVLLLDNMNILTKLQKDFPELKIIIMTNDAAKNTQITVDALMLGIEDFVTKPKLSSVEFFIQEILQKMSILSNESQPHEIKENIATKSIKEFKPWRSELNKRDIRAIAIASSTGGPKALSNLLENIGDLHKLSDIPIFITQHMPPNFTTKLAESLNVISKRNCREGQDGEVVHRNNIYIAPGGFHMAFKGNEINLKIVTNEDPQENFCRPSADHMIRSLLKVYGDSLLVIVLTGMGADGLKATKMAKDKGCYIVAQDQETSVVWGMPGAVAKAGLCDQILPIDEIANHLTHIVR